MVLSKFGYIINVISQFVLLKLRRSLILDFRLCMYKYIVDIYAFSEIRVKKNLHTNVCRYVVLPKYVISFTGCKTIEKNIKCFKAV